VFFQKFPVRIHLEAPLFAACSNNDLKIPFAIRVVFSFYPNDLSSRCLSFNCVTEQRQGSSAGRPPKKCLAINYNFVIMPGVL
jgi:hypothetical protein